jgi:hypothetical protein
MAGASKVSLTFTAEQWNDAAGRPFFTSPFFLPDLPGLYPSFEPLLEARRSNLSAGRGLRDCASAQYSGASHNDQAAKSQYLLFPSRRCVLRLCDCQESNSDG